MEFITNLNLLVLFAIIGGVGFLFLLISLVVGDVFEAVGFDLDGGANGTDFGLLDSRVLAVFLTAFGGFGVIAVQNGFGGVAASIAGLLGGVLYVAATAVLLSGAMGAQFMDQIREAMSNNPEIPAEVRDRMVELTGSGALALIVAAVTILIYAVFSMAGALIGLAIFKKKVPPPTTPGPTFTP